MRASMQRCEDGRSPVSETVTLCAKDELEPGEARRFDVAGRRIALVRIGDEFHAVDDECSHEDYSLAEGEVWADECEIECPRHGSTFDLLTGAPCSLPATQPISVYKVVVDGDHVAVELP
jgi:3-phenylpropionate/trans-cinnamate dioxygenase ferredoxin subunit